VAAAPCRSAAPSLRRCEPVRSFDRCRVGEHDGHALTMRFQNHDEFPQCDRCPASRRWEEHRRFVGKLGNFQSALWGVYARHSEPQGAELSATIFRSLRQAIPATPPSRQSRDQWGPDSSIVPIIVDKRAIPRIIAKHSRSRRPPPEAHLRGFNTEVGLIRTRQLQAGSNQAISLSGECICANWLVF
jgi:hypothetical protein